MITENDLRWMAGVIEAKGRLRRKLVRSNRGRVVPDHYQEECLLLHVSTPPGVANEMARLALTEVRAVRGREVTAFSCKKHCPEPHVHVYVEPFVTLSLHGVRAHIVIWNVLNFMRCRQEEFCAHMDKYPARDSYSGRGIAREMEAQGWEFPGFSNQLIGTHHKNRQHEQAG